MKQIRENILSFCKKSEENIWLFRKKPYLCIRYPENNLFTLKRLIPIEDLERLPVKAIAFFYVITFPIIYNVIRRQRTIVQLFTKMERKRI